MSTNMVQYLSGSNLISQSINSTPIEIIYHPVTTNMDGFMDTTGGNDTFKYSLMNREGGIGSLATVSVKVDEVAPKLVTPYTIHDQSVFTGKNIVIPNLSQLFSDVDPNDVLTYSATWVDMNDSSKTGTISLNPTSGEGGWLTINGSTISGQFLQNVNSALTLGISVTATDSHGVDNTVSTTAFNAFKITELTAPATQSFDVNDSDSITIPIFSSSQGGLFYNDGTGNLLGKLVFPSTIGETGITIHFDGSVVGNSADISNVLEIDMGASSNQVEAFDNNGNIVNYTLPTGINPQTITFTPLQAIPNLDSFENSNPGNIYNFEYSLRNSFGESPLSTDSITIHEVSPTISTDIDGNNIQIADQSPYEGDPFDFNITSVIPLNGNTPIPTFNNPDSNDPITYQAYIVDAQGHLTPVNQAGTWLGFNGTDILGTPQYSDIGSFTIEIVANDPENSALQASEQFKINVLAHPVTANADSYYTSASESITIPFSSLLSNDVYARIDVPTITIDHTGLYGSTGINYDTSGIPISVSYTPPSDLTNLEANNNGLDSFKYTITDSHGQSSTAAVNVQVSTTPAYNVADNSTITIPISHDSGGLLYNIDPSLTIGRLQFPSSSTGTGVTVHFNGNLVGGGQTVSDVSSIDMTQSVNQVSYYNFTSGHVNYISIPVGVVPDAIIYSPLNNIANLDTFEFNHPGNIYTFNYSLINSTGQDGSLTTVNINVNEVSPTISTDVNGHNIQIADQIAQEFVPFNFDITTTKGVPTFINPDTNDPDMTYQAYIVDAQGHLTPVNQAGTWLGFNGVALNGVPLATDVTGSSSPITVEIVASDGNSQTLKASETFKISVAAQGPVARAQSFVTSENEPLTITPSDLLLNDTYNHSSPPTITWDPTGLVGTLVPNYNTNGVLVSWSYTPPSNMDSFETSHPDLQDNFSYTLTDGANQTSTNTASIEVQEVPPSYVFAKSFPSDQNAVIGTNWSQSVNGLFSDVDPNDVLTYTAKLFDKQGHYIRDLDANTHTSDTNLFGVVGNWITFDSSTLMLSGTPLQTTSESDYSTQATIEIFATDSHGVNSTQSVTIPLNLTVLPPKPVAIAPPAGTFSVAENDFIPIHIFSDLLSHDTYPSYAAAKLTSLDLSGLYLSGLEPPNNDGTVVLFSDGNKSYNVQSISLIGAEYKVVSTAGEVTFTNPNVSLTEIDYIPLHAISNMDSFQILNDGNATINYTIANSGGSSSATANILVTEVAPTFLPGINTVNYTSSAGNLFSLNLNTLYSDADPNDILTYTVQQTGDTDNWLIFNNDSRISGTPLAADAGKTITVMITATDQDGSSSVHTTNTITISTVIPPKVTSTLNTVNNLYYSYSNTISEDTITDAFKVYASDLTKNTESQYSDIINGSSVRENVTVNSLDFSRLVHSGNGVKVYFNPGPGQSLVSYDNVVTFDNVSHTLLIAGNVITLYSNYTFDHFSYTPLASTTNLLPAITNMDTFDAVNKGIDSFNYTVTDAHGGVSNASGSIAVEEVPATLNLNSSTIPVNSKGIPELSLAPGNSLDIQDISTLFLNPDKNDAFTYNDNVNNTVTWEDAAGNKGTVGLSPSSGTGGWLTLNGATIFGIPSPSNITDTIDSTTHAPISHQLTVYITPVDGFDALVTEPKQPTYSFLINVVNPPVVVADNSFKTDENSPLTIFVSDLLANDYDARNNTSTPHENLVINKLDFVTNSFFDNFNPFSQSSVEFIDSDEKFHTYSNILFVDMSKHTGQVTEYNVGTVTLPSDWKPYAIIYTPPLDNMASLEQLNNSKDYFNYTVSNISNPNSVYSSTPTSTPSVTINVTDVPPSLSLSKTNPIDPAANVAATNNAYSFDLTTGLLTHHPLFSEVDPYDTLTYTVKLYDTSGTFIRVLDSSPGLGFGGWLQFDGTKIFGTPSVTDENNIYTIKIQATDPDGKTGSDLASYSLTVDKPVIAKTYTNTVNELLTYQIY